MKNFVFDLGAVLLQWNPEAIASDFSGDQVEQALLLEQVFRHSDWLQMDRGALSEAEFIDRASTRTPWTRQRLADLLHRTKESLLPIRQTEQLLQRAHQCERQLYCLSNMSVEVYRHIKDKHAFFTRFNGIVISGQEKVAKPSREIFSILLERFALTPAETVFIDDSAANIDTARGLGIHAIQFTQTPACYRQIAGILEAAARE